MGAFAANIRKRLDRPASVRSFCRDESGATSIEYGLIVALIFLAIVGAIRSYTNTTSDMYSTISDTLDDK